MSLYDEHGTPLFKSADCSVCDEDEIASSGTVAWCYLCGWNGHVRDHLIGPVLPEDEKEVTE